MVTLELVLPTPYGDQVEDVADVNEQSKSVCLNQHCLVPRATLRELSVDLQDVVLGVSKVKRPVAPDLVSRRVQDRDAKTGKLLKPIVNFGVRHTECQLHRRTPPVS